MDANAVCAQLRERADSLERGEAQIASWFARELRDAADVLQAEAHVGAIAQSRNERLSQENAELRAAERGLRAALVALENLVAAENARFDELSLEAQRLRQAGTASEDRREPGDG